MVFLSSWFRFGEPSYSEVLLKTASSDDDDDDDDDSKVDDASLLVARFRLFYPNAARAAMCIREGSASKEDAKEKGAAALSFSNMDGIRGGTALHFTGMQKDHPKYGHSWASCITWYVIFMVSVIASSFLVSWIFPNNDDVQTWTSSSAAVFRSLIIYAFLLPPLFLANHLRNRMDENWEPRTKARESFRTDMEARVARLVEILQPLGLKVTTQDCPQDKGDKRGRVWWTRSNPKNNPSNLFSGDAIRITITKSATFPKEKDETSAGDAKSLVLPPVTPRTTDTPLVTEVKASAFQLGVSVRNTPLDDWLAGALMLRLRLSGELGTSQTRRCAQILCCPVFVYWLVVMCAVLFFVTLTEYLILCAVGVVLLFLVVIILAYYRESKEGSNLHSEWSNLVEEFSAVAEERVRHSIAYEVKPAALPGITQGVIHFNTMTDPTTTNEIV